MQTLEKPRLFQVRPIDHALPRWYCAVHMPGDQYATAGIETTPLAAYMSIAKWVHTHGYTLPNYKG